MKRVWHLVRKDLRRMWLPVGLWLGLVLAEPAMLLSVTGRVEVGTDGFETARAAAGVLVVLRVVVGFLLAAWVVMEDAPANPDAWWPTRPVGGMRLLTAKVLAVALLLIVAPVLVLTPVWLAADFSAGQWMTAAGEVAVLQALVSAEAVAIGAVAASSGTFLNRTIGLLLGPAVLFGFLTVGQGPMNHLAQDLQSTRLALAARVLAIGFGAAVVHQFCTRRTRRSALAMAAAVAASAAILALWPWQVAGDSQGDAALPWRVEATWNVAGEEVRRGPLSDEPRRVKTLALEVEATGADAAGYLRVQRARANWISGDGAWPGPYFQPRSPGGGEGWAERAALRLAGGSGEAPATGPWDLIAQQDAGEFAAAVAGRPAVCGGLAEIEFLRGRPVGELPVREGVELARGAHRIWLRKIETTPERLRVTIEERDMRWGEESFVWLDRARGLAQVARVTAIGSVRSGGIMVGQKILEFVPPGRESGRRAGTIAEGGEDGVLLPVRFEVERRGWVSFKSGPAGLRH